MIEKAGENKRGGTRQGAGRKKAEHPTQRITLRIPERTINLLKMYAQFYNRTISAEIINAIEDYLDKQCCEDNTFHAPDEML